MKYSIITLAIVVLFFACDQSADYDRTSRSRIDSLEKKLADSYKPGFGEFMSSIQVHHTKLWFAGQNQNWKLADFEVHEIMETLEDIKTYQAEREESQKIGMLDPALDSVNHAIQQKDITLFKNSYVLLTNTCNNCHHAVKFEFNVVKIPDTPPFTDQDFKSGNSQ